VTDDALIPPDDARFQGAQFISAEAMIQYRVANFTNL